MLKEFKFITVAFVKYVYLPVFVRTFKQINQFMFMNSIHVHEFNS